MNNRNIKIFELFTILLCLSAASPSFGAAPGPTLSILSPTDGKAVYTSGTASYPIRIVFSAWDNDGTGAITNYQFSSNGGSTWSGITPVNYGLSDNKIYRYYDWTPASSGNYLIQLRATDGTNTGSSRKVSISVRVTTIDNYSGFPGDGTLLVRDNDNTICISCHALKSHSSADLGDAGSTTYGNWERVCRDCHTPHNTRNIFLLQSSFKVYTGTNQTFAYRKKVDFRNLSGGSNYGFATQSGGNRRGPCEVCHTKTKNTNDSARWRNYTSVLDVDGKKHNYDLSCISCHDHSSGFAAGESRGNSKCSSCHANIYNPMNTVEGGYHHYMNNADVTTLASGSKYPNATSLHSTADSNRRCLACHVDHDIFRPDINGSSPGRSYNLRNDANAAPGATSGRNSDYVSAETNGGLCLSCHRRSQSKSFTQPDGTAKTPVITKSLFDSSPHNFNVAGRIRKDSSVFNANCLKCHNDTMAKTKWANSTSFSLHDSTIRRLNATMPNPSNTGLGDTFLTRTTIGDSGKNWTSNAWLYYKVYILTGAQAGQAKNVIANTENRIRFKSALASPIASGDRYLIGDSRDFDSGTATGGSTSTIQARGKGWIPNYWKNRPVNILGGTNFGLKKKILSNTTSTLRVDTAYPSAINTSSVFSIGDPAEEDFCFRCHSRQTNPNASIKKDFYGVQSFVNGKALRMEDVFAGNSDNGRVSAATTTTITDSSKSWAADDWSGMNVKIVAGRGRNQTRAITSNTATQITVTPAWTTTPDTTSRYVVGAGNPYRHRIDSYFGAHRTAESEIAPDTATSTGWFADTGIGTHVGCSDCHNPHGNRKPGEDYGTATFGSVSTVQQTGKNWTTDQWRGYLLRLMDGTGAGQDRMIVSNTSNNIKVGAAFGTAPGSGTYFIILPAGHMTKGNNLSGPNNAAWGVQITYTTPALGNYTVRSITKKKELVSGSDKVYQLCFKCHSDYSWGRSGTPFKIPDALSNTLGNFTTNPSTEIAREFNPKNLGHHAVVEPGENQPITAMGGNPINVAGPYAISAGATASVTVSANLGTANRYSGRCVEIVGTGTGNGQIRSISSHTVGATSVITVDPAFSTAPGTANNQAYIRECSIYNNGSNYSGTGVVPWPRFTGTTLSATNGSSTVTISTLTNGIPSTVIPGWYLYIGTLYTAANTLVMPNVGACSATAPCPPMFATTGWYQVTAISAGASGPGVNSATLTITPSFSGTTGTNKSFALSAGLGNTFVPPYGPWSVISCADCHDTDNATDPTGPHGSASPWILRNLEAQNFPWFYGGETNATSTTNATLVRTVSYPDGTGSWGTNGNDKYLCLNCHRADVYGYEDRSPAVNATLPAGAGFTNFAWRIMSRLPHVPTGGDGRPTDSDGSQGAAWVNSYNINCMHCHAGDARATKTVGTEYNALGGLHGSNLGKAAAGGTSYRGRRLLNGATWIGVTRATTGTAVACWTLGAGDGVSSCAQGHGGTGGEKANYPYFSGSDQ